MKRTTHQPSVIRIHQQDCGCTICQPAKWHPTALDVICLQMLAGFIVTLVLIELYAIATGAPHVTVIFGGLG